MHNRAARWGEVAEELIGEAVILLGPTLLLKGIIPAFAPEIGVVGGEAVEGESSNDCFSR